MEIKGKVALVTGGASGIGLGIVAEFLKAGIKGILITDINAPVGEKVFEELNKQFGSKRISFMKVDVTNAAEYEGAFKRTLHVFGKPDIVVNNAGIPDESNHQRLIDINFTAMVRGTDLGLKYLGKDQNGNGGLIINIASIAALEVTYPVPIYTATKTGIAGLVRAWGHPFHYNRTGVRIIGLCPGKTSTRFFQCEKLLKNEEWVNHTDPQESQNPDVIGRAAVYVAKNGKSGSLWVIERSKLFKTNMPDRASFSEFVMDLI